MEIKKIVNIHKVIPTNIIMSNNIQPLRLGTKMPLLIWIKYRVSHFHFFQIWKISLPFSLYSPLPSTSFRRLRPCLQLPPPSTAFSSMTSTAWLLWFTIYTGAALFSSAPDPALPSCYSRASISLLLLLPMFCKF